MPLFYYVLLSLSCISSLYCSSTTQTLIASTSTHNNIIFCKKRAIDNIEKQKQDPSQKVQIIENGNSYKSSSKVYLAATDLGEKIKERNNLLLLVDVPGNIDTVDAHGETLLHLAIEKNKIDAVTKLLKKNVDIFRHNKRHQTALHQAVDYKNLPIINLLLHHVAKQNASDSLQRFLEIKDSDGATALLHAVQQNQTFIAELLIKFGANIFTTNHHEHSLLHFVQDPALAQNLINAGLDVNYQGRFNNSPLHFAANEDIVLVLLENKANIHALSDEGNTPLHTAKTTAIAQVLLTAGAYVNYKNYKNNPPLYFAIKNLNTARCHLLLEHGADENIVNPGVIAKYKIHSRSYLADNFIQEMRVTNKLEPFFTNICPAFPYTYQEDIEYQYLRNLSLQCVLTENPMNIKDFERFKQLYQLVCLGTFNYLASIDNRLLKAYQDTTDNKITTNLNTINAYITEQEEHHRKIDADLTFKNKSSIAVNALSQFIAHNLTTT